MGTEITANTDLESLAQRLGVGEAEELRSSKSRREPHLQKYARLLGGMPDIDLQLNPDLAAADMEAGRKIYIPCREFPQPVTDIPERTYDLLVQEMLATHEVGHLLYSDWPTLKAFIGDIEEEAEQRFEDDDPKDWAATFKDFWNAAEDGVIESELGKAFIVEDELEIYNANMSDAGSIAKLTQNEQGKDVYVYPMKDAISQALVDLSIYDSGKLDRLLDPDDPKHTFYLKEDENRFREILPELERIVDEMMNEPDGRKRNKVFFDFFRDILFDVLDLSQVSGVRNSSGEDNGMEESRSDDAHKGMGEAQEELQFAPEGGDSGEEEEEKEQEDGQGAGEGDGDEESESRSGEEKAEERYQQTLKQEMKDAVGESMMDEIETFKTVMQGGTPADIDRIYVPDPKPVDVETRNEARRVGRQIKPIIANQLRESKMDQYQRQRSTGELDTRSMVDAERGSVRVFKRQKNEGDKDYSITLLLDRSGSMSSCVRDTEIAVGAFLYALEDLGVDTMCLDFYSSHLRLAKPFGQPVADSEGTLFTGENGGGTPLSGSLFFARRRIEEGAGTHPAIMVITDGGAGRRGQYLSELKKCNIPVIGLYLLGGMRRGNLGDFEEAKNFHRFRAVSNDESLVTVLQQLSREVML